MYCECEKLRLNDIDDNGKCVNCGLKVIFLKITQLLDATIREEDKVEIEKREGK